MDKRNKKVIQNIVKMFSELNGSTFVGLRDYIAKSGEVANHVVIADFSYKNAINKDLNALLMATSEDIDAIANKGFSVEFIIATMQKLIDSFVNNKNPETASNQSKAQNESYIIINNCIKVCISTKNILLYALSVKKYVVTPAPSKESKKSSELVLCQNAIRKHFNLSTAKYRSFIVDENQLSKIVCNGEEYEFV